MRILFLLTSLTFVGCSHAVSPKLVKTKAASDFECPREDVEVTQVTGNNWKAKGCEKHASYICSDANFMHDGVCMRE